MRGRAAAAGGELEGVLAEAVRAGQLQTETGELLLVGFDQLTPARQGLLEAMRMAGVRVGSVEAGAVPRRRVLTVAEDEREELRACARWAAAWVKREPTARIAVIVPDAARERAGVERVFREVLAPELQSIVTGETMAPYEFSLGRAVAETPMVAVALELLRWMTGAIPTERASALLVSEYFAGRSLPGKKGEREARAAFDATELRRGQRLRPEIRVREMVRLLAGSRRSERLPVLLRALRQMERMGAEMEGAPRSYGEWTQRMRDLLVAAGWGAGGAETSEEFQARERWESVLDAVTTLDFEGGAGGVRRRAAGGGADCG